MKLVLSCAIGALLCASLRTIYASDATISADDDERSGDRGPLLVDNYIPVTMQILQHCIEMIQYEPTMTPPNAEAEIKPSTTTTTTTKRPTRTTTTAASSTSSTSTSKPPQDSPLSTAKPADATLSPTSPHRPGYYGPAKPPPTVVTTTTGKPTITSSTTTTEMPKVNESPTTETLLWSDKPFAEWFLQSKRKKVQPISSLNVQLLDPLPLRVLQDFNREPYEPLALRPEDNANEFRRLYDDNYRGPISLLVLEKGTKKGGKKRVPPTKPYLHMLVLYDMLKREAKKNMYSIYEGYSEAILGELSVMDFPNAKEQLHYALTQLLERKDIEKADVVSRSKQMITDLSTRNSAITMALEVIPPLRFGL